MISSHISREICSRTCRAFSRAVVMQLMIEFGFFGLSVRKSMTFSLLVILVMLVEILVVAGAAQDRLPERLLFLGRRAWAGRA